MQGQVTQNEPMVETDQDRLDLIGGSYPLATQSSTRSNSVARKARVSSRTW